MQRRRLGKRNMDLSLGTWNVRTLYETAAANILVEELTKCKIQILALQKTRWKDNNTFRVRDYSFFCSGGQKQVLGVGFAVHKSLHNSIREFLPINGRICTLRVRTKFFNLTLINVHAETEDKEDIIKDAFYSKLEQIFDKIPSNDIKIVLEDFNAKI